ncbi:OLC1v1009424C1 [Oldenlandia corymbosa var. corymbosa]|uniref:OLC1v1009424C1 n=1 Tax=Oldenlandia corymbosa var. corymbosa TaxID=529605 RepID=A0AAV1DNW6_OLDCO|nr:OLC1v1009424C1 [Oldenlandia corymbosa var. corymbosa]
MDRITAKIQSPSWPFGAVPAFSRPPAPRGAAGKGGGGKGRKPAGLTADDALCYLTEVQTAFKDKKEKYQMFIDIMKDFHNQRIDSKAVLTKVKAVFKHHPALIHGFNAFLPRGYEITLKGGARVPRKEKLDFEDALAFVHKVKAGTQGHARTLSRDCCTSEISSRLVASVHKVFAPRFHVRHVVRPDL